MDPTPDIPQTRKCYCYDPESKSCKWKDVSIPTLGENFVLIKMESSVIHPVDHLYLSFPDEMGMGAGPGPHCLGVEGSGTVIAAGPGKSTTFINKKVTAMSSLAPGLWSDYAIVHVNNVIVISDNIPAEDRAYAMMNPLTSLMLLDLAHKIHSKAAINTAAGSCLGRNIEKLFNKNGIEVINVVRKPEKVTNLLEKEGAKHALNSTDPEFDTKLRDLATTLHVNLLMDAVGGETLTQVSSLTPKGSTICLYGGLAKSSTATLNVPDLFDGKILMGCALYSWWARQTAEERLKHCETINNEFSSVFKVNIIKTFKFMELDEAMKTYNENITGPSIDGKYILKWE